MRQVDGGSKIFFLCGCIFSIVGTIFLIVFVLLITNWDAVSARGRGDVWILPLIFGALSVLLLVIGMGLLRQFRRSKEKVQRLLARGEYVIANITGFPIDYRMYVNGMPTFRIECSYRDPETGVLHIFQSENLLFDPAYTVEAQTVRVYVDKSTGYRDHYVDVDPILPQVMRH